MNTDLQSKCWACLPKEAREFAKHEFRKSTCNHVLQLLTEMFGSHNLTSDTEPEEMLMVKRKDAIDFYNKYVGNPTREISRLSLRKEINSLFGDKCLPDKEKSVQGEPKFNLRDKVKIKNEDIASVIDSIEKMPDGSFNYHLHHVEPSVRESDLEPYTEPETKDAYEQYQDAKAEEYGNQLKDMEGKELNLIEILKDCPLDTPLFSLSLGDVTLYEILPENDDRSIRICKKDAVGNEKIYARDANGKLHKDGFVDLLPSRTLYEKYPLDAKKAWDEWSQERKPKFWRAKNGEYYWNINSIGELESCIDRRRQIDIDRYHIGNYFRTYELANQAAEAVRETLIKIHEKQ